MTGNQTDLKLDWVCFVCPHCLYGQQGVKLSWQTLDYPALYPSTTAEGNRHVELWMTNVHGGMCAHYEKCRSPWILLRVACIRIMKTKNVQVHEYCLGRHVRTFCMKKFTLTFNTLICKLIIIKLMVAVVMLFIFICPFIFILFVCPVSVKCPEC